MPKRNPTAGTILHSLLLLCFALGVQAWAAQSWADERADCERRYTAQTGQPGKDVIWVPTSDALVNHMLKMAGVTSADLVYDLGAGDGKIAIAAARDFGARAVGVEYNPQLAQLGECLAKAEGVADRVRIIHGDIFETDFSNATVVTLYLLPELNLRLRPTILKMKPGTRVVSHSFLMDDWEPDERSMTDGGQAYLWIVPADVAGEWTFRADKGGGEEFIVQIDQTFQQISGMAGEQHHRLEDARLRGGSIEFSFLQDGAPARLTGRVSGDRIEAQVVRGGKTSSYVGTR